MYDFDTPLDRRQSHSMKWNVGEQELPMWVADMDFATAPEIQAAIQKRAAHGAFGYSDIPAAWQHAYQRWWRARHDFTIEDDWLIFCTGVVPAISSMVRKLTTPAEKVVLMTPVYGIFFNSVLNNGRQVLESPLVYENGAYHIDFADLESKLADPQTSLLILCNPHNPIGKLWDAATLERIGTLCHRHHVVVISDEIHGDLTAPDRAYTPFASVSACCRDNSITCLAPTKTFNLAGLQTAAVMVPNPVLRHKVWRGLNTDEVAEPNAFAIDATIAAFQEGDAWLDALRAYLWENRLAATRFIAQHIPSLHVVEGEATYLLWLEVTDPAVAATDVATRLRQATGLYLSAGHGFGGNGAAFLRMNIACPRTRLQDGLERLQRGMTLLGQETP